MRLAPPLYPVDRYLVESSNKTDMIKIIEDDLWKPETALRPEDECLLRKLHEMLKSTADDLKLLSGELAKYHESGVQVKTLPTPLDEDFNEKIHIEEIVNAKFHGYKIIHPLQLSAVSHKPTDMQRECIASAVRDKSLVNCRPLITPPPVQKKYLKKLGISRTKVVHIPESAKNILDNKSVHSKNVSKTSRDKPVIYSEIVHQYADKTKDDYLEALQVQEMPGINIRSELKSQNVLQLNILPDMNAHVDNSRSKNNVCVIAVNHEGPLEYYNDNHRINVDFEPRPVRKISKMPLCESSESSRNLERKQNYKKEYSIRKTRQKTNALDNSVTKKASINGQTSLNDWKTKLNAVYGQSSKNKKSSVIGNKIGRKSLNFEEPFKTVSQIGKTNVLNNNTEYIPYTKLTLGGVNIKDIENEMSHGSNKNDFPRSPTLENVLTRQNSHRNKQSQVKDKVYSKVLTTSDENLLQEVLDIEEKVSITLSKNLDKDNGNALPCTLNTNLSDSVNDENTYADDFEVDNSLEFSAGNVPQELQSPDISLKLNIINPDLNRISTEEDGRNKTYVKVSNLSLKKQIDTFEFIHTVDTQDCAIQSSTTNKISLKETQTSPRNDIQTIRNDLTIDPTNEVGKMFNLEKDFIKKLIVSEYSDLIVNLNKPSTSNESKDDIDSKNVSTIQKNTQTSPARSKNVMTSPTKTKTRTTSPFALSLTVNKQTSPLIDMSNEHNLGSRDSHNSVNVDDNELDITINLSSPHFNLRLPQSLDISKSNRYVKDRTIKPKTFKLSSSSSSVEDYSSSDISLGEINRQYRRRLGRYKILSLSEASSSISQNLDQLNVNPTQSEGEVSVYQTRSNKYSKSEGEVSVGQVK